ncbi:papain inhibitor-like [Paramacrobiotus metropolitanus]|uniref:papain inhibitor-like n=1 Tax=Paramacrobiotus metropolitanus TaxID=2943436 RepID=UPI002445DC81|nr:papain inhibitor-like [Paramacrobiotus metropolitanus]
MSHCMVILYFLALVCGAFAFSGDATWYDVGLGACGQWSNNNQLVAAISPSQYGWHANPNTAAVCRTCASVRAGGRQVKVKIVDKCDGCASGSIDLSPGAFQRLASLDTGRIRVTWDYVSC